MVRTIKQVVTVKPGGLIEVRAPELEVGIPVEVVVTQQVEQNSPPPLSSLIGRVKGCFSSGAEADAFIRAERDAWED